MTEKNEKILKQLEKELNDYIIPKLKKEGMVYLNDSGIRKILGFESQDNNSHCLIRWAQR